MSIWIPCKRSTAICKRPTPSLPEACRRQGGIAADEGYSLLGQQSPHAGAVRGREEARTEALHHGEDEVSARAEQQSAGAENSATEKTEYGTVRHLPFSV